MKPLVLQRAFLMGSAIELSLAGLAAVLAAVFGLPLGSYLQWRAADFGIGCLAAAPLFGLLVWMLRSRSPGVVQFRSDLDRMIRPMFERWSVLELGLISLIAGISEELLFRGVVQGGLSEGLGPWPAAIIAACLFGLFHWLSPGYAAVTAAVGLYLGAIWIFSGNLLVPVTTHAVYDFAALIFYLRTGSANIGGVQMKRDRDGESGTD